VSSDLLLEFLLKEDNNNNNNRQINNETEKQTLGVTSLAEVKKVSFAVATIE